MNRCFIKALKKINCRFFLLLIVMFVLLSCSKEYDPDLRAKWQLREVRVNDNVIQKYDSVFYNFDNYVFCYLKLLPNSFESFQTV